MKIFVLTNSNLNFSALVPKAQYSGVPRLTLKSIAGINEMKALIKQTERDMIEAENNMVNPDNSDALRQVFHDRLVILGDYKDLLSEEIADVKKNNHFYPKRLESIQKSWTETMKALDTGFDKENTHINIYR